jgi:hypothetical protein
MTLLCVAQMFTKQKTKWTDMTPENIIRMEEVSHLHSPDIHMPCSPCISGDEFAAALTRAPQISNCLAIVDPCGYSRYVKSTYIRLGAGR